MGVCAHLRRTDWITSTHRGHGHALAKGGDPKRRMAELFGKVDGICGGRGGTMLRGGDGSIIGGGGSSGGISSSRGLQWQCDGGDGGGGGGTGGGDVE